MEINLNCDLGEKSIHYNGVNDLSLLRIVNTVNIACGFHAGDLKTIEKTIKNAKTNMVSIGAHPGFNDLKNFGRKRINLPSHELKKIIHQQLEIINKIALKNNLPLTHVKPHGALNNMACENFEIAFNIGEVIKKFDKNLIYVVLPLTEMEKAAKKLDIKFACEIFADRSYEDNGYLFSRSKINSSLYDPITISNNIIEMIKSSSIKCFSGKKIKCDIDTICIHGDGENAINIAKCIKKKLIKNNIKLLALNKLSKFK